MSLGECMLLREDPSLRAALPPADRAEADELLKVGCFDVGHGPWAPTEREQGEAAYMLLAGKLLREVRIQEQWSAELLLAGDILRPWLEDATSFTESRWFCLERSRVAVLTTTNFQAFARWPVLLDAFLERALLRSRSLATLTAIEGVRRTQERVFFLLWHLAERCGERQGSTVRVEIDLTHEQIARLVGSRRQTVTTALGELKADGRLEVDKRTFVLRGDPPRAGSSAR